MVGVSLVVLAPLVAAATWGRDDRSFLGAYLTTLGSIAAIVVAGAFFIGLEIHRHRRFRELAGPNRAGDLRRAATGRSDRDQPTDSAPI